MPNKELLKQLEIEKQRRGINRANAVPNGDSEIRGYGSSEHRFAWEYELEAYRKQKNKVKWLTVGAVCGVISLVLEVGLHWSNIAELGKLWPYK